MGLQVDFSGLPAGVVEEFRKGRLAREVLALQQAPRLQDLAARAQPVTQRSIEGLGRPRLNITADAFHYWGRRLGYDCWKDKQFLREFWRDNQNARVKSSGTKIQVGYRGYVASDALKQKYPAKIIT